MYEQDFLGFSYGFRPLRSPHQALARILHVGWRRGRNSLLGHRKLNHAKLRSIHTRAGRSATEDPASVQFARRQPTTRAISGLDAFNVALTEKRVNWILDADIEGFFDAIDHSWLIKFLEHRIGDRRVLRLIRKWLRAGILEDGIWSKTEEGTPQGSGISPLAAEYPTASVIHPGADQGRTASADARPAGCHRSLATTRRSGLVELSCGSRQLRPYPPLCVRRGPSLAPRLATSESTCVPHLDLATNASRAGQVPSSSPHSAPLPRHSLSRST